MRKHDRNSHIHGMWTRDGDLTTGASNGPTRAQAMAAVSSVGQVVYAMRVAGCLIKIGTTTDLAERRRYLRGEMLAVMFGGYAEEQALHARLAGHVHHGREWYHPTPEVLAVVNEMRDSMGMDALSA